MPKPSAAEDDDPIIRSFPVFVKPPLPAHRQLVILQYPNTYGSDPRELPVPDVAELRIKPATGIVEVDEPIETAGEQYDRIKGKTWGVALKRTVAAKEGGSLGLAGGFGVGAPQVRAPRGGGGMEDDLTLPWSEALRQDLVLRTRTLGGRAVNETDAKYMVATFPGGRSVHLTPVSSIVTLRPNLHHLDATSEQDRLSRTSAAAAAAAAAGGGAGPKEGGAARAIHMTLKAAMDEEGVLTETIGDRLKAVQTESWKRLEYMHQDSAASWDAYEENLVLKAKLAAAADDKGKGKGKSKEAAAAVADDDDEGADPAKKLIQQVPRLEVDWVEEDLLRAVSGYSGTQRKPGEELPAAATAIKKEKDSKGKGKGKEKESAPKKKAGRPQKASAAGPSVLKRGSRAKGGNAEDPMELGD